MTQTPAPAVPDLLLEFVLGLLAPLLIGGPISDLTQARHAALQAIEAYGSAIPLLTAAQITALAVTALDNLRLSMDQPVPLCLRLRANAASLSRAAGAHTEPPSRTSRPPQPEAAPTMPKPAVPEPAAPERAATAPTVPAKSAETARQNQRHWAGAMRQAADELRGNAAAATPEQRRKDALWINALTTVAGDLSQGRIPAPQPGASRAALLRSTLMASNPDFPARLAGAVPSRRAAR